MMSMIFKVLLGFFVIIFSFLSLIFNAIKKVIDFIRSKLSGNKLRKTYQKNNKIIDLEEKDYYEKND